MQYVTLSGLFSAIFAAAALIFAEGDEVIFPPKGKVLIITALSAAIGGISYMLQLTGAPSLPATVLYPFVTGGSIIFSTVVDLIVFKEKLSLKLSLSIVLCFLGHYYLYREKRLWIF